jgi:hypothetical protein
LKICLDSPKVGAVVNKRVWIILKYIVSRLKLYKIPATQPYAREVEEKTW